MSELAEPSRTGDSKASSPPIIDSGEDTLNKSAVTDGSSIPDHEKAQVKELVGSIAAQMISATTQTSHPVLEKFAESHVTELISLDRLKETNRHQLAIIAIITCAVTLLSVLALLLHYGKTELITTILSLIGVGIGGGGIGVAIQKKRGS